MSCLHEILDASLLPLSEEDQQLYDSDIVVPGGFSFDAPLGVYRGRVCRPCPLCQKKSFWMRTGLSIDLGPDHLYAIECRCSGITQVQPHAVLRILRGDPMPILRNPW